MIVTALISPTKRSTANVSLVAATTSAASWPFQRSRREVTLLRARPVARAATSAFVRPAHQLEGRLDVPPSFGVFAFALLFQGTSLERPRQWPCRRVLPIIAERSRRLRFPAFSWRHTPFLQRASAYRSRARTVDVDTYQELHLHLSMSQRQESANGLVPPVQGE